MIIKEIVHDEYSPDKPNVLILTGVHGNEITPIKCAQMILDTAPQWQNFNKMTIIFGVNLPALRHCSREFVKQTSNDINRDYEETFDIRSIIDNLVNKEKYQIVIDVHSSPKISELFLVDASKEQEHIFNFMNKSRLPFVLWRKAPYTTIKSLANERDIHGFTLELNEINSIDEVSANSGVFLIKYILDNFKLLEEEKKSPVEQNIKYKFPVDVYSNSEGIFYLQEDLGRIVNEGDLIGSIHSIDTNECIENVYAPISGFLFEATWKSFVTYRDCLLSIQPDNFQNQEETKDD